MVALAPPVSREPFAPNGSILVIWSGGESWVRDRQALNIALMTSTSPVAIKRRDDGVEITWAAGAPPVLYPARPLRLACPCAECVEEMTGAPLLDPARVA